MRTFIAIDIPPISEIQNILTDFDQNLKGLDIKYTEPTNYHVTLAFLGETADSKIKLLCKDLDAITPNKIELSLNGLGVFRNATNPLILWIGMETDSNLTDLWNHVSQIVSKHGFKQNEQEFSPHLTIGMVRKANRNHNLSMFLEKYKRSFFGKISLNEFVFYQSILTQQGSIYKPIRKFKQSATH